MPYVIVALDYPEARMLVFGPFETVEEAHEYADQNSGTWNGYNVLKMEKKYE